jgi:hypothetical protein
VYGEVILTVAMKTPKTLKRKNQKVVVQNVFLLTPLILTLTLTHSHSHSHSLKLTTTHSVQSNNS